MRTESPAFAPVIALLESADQTAREVGYPDASLRDAYHRQVLMLLSQAYVQVFGTSVEHPDWVPHCGPLFPWGAPNHDTIYSFAPIDVNGLYRVSGKKGTEIIASLMFRKGGANTGQVHGATLGEVDVQAVSTDADQSFSMLISRRRPDGFTGNWFAIPPETTGMLARHVTQLPSQHDGAWALERLDRAPAPCSLTADEVAVRSRNMTSFVQRLNEILLRLIVKLRADGHTNKFVSERFQGNGGIAAQLYFQSLFEFDADEVLLIESDVPTISRYWSVQLVDPFYSAIDFTFHSSAFNGHQAHFDSDGKVRFVVSTTDPGTPNWLDSAGWRRGGILWRWHTASSYPEPTIKRIKFAQLGQALPADSPRIDASRRQAERSARISQYQSRRRW